MASSPGSSDLSSPPSEDYEDQLSIVGPSSRPSVEITHPDTEHLAPPSKRRKTAKPPLSLLSTFDRAPSSQAGDAPDTPTAAAAAQIDDNISVSEDGFSDAPCSPTDDEYAMRDAAQTECQWRDCDYGRALNNDELVQHVQIQHCATGGPKKTKYVCEWGECQKKASNHPSGYALKAHMRSHTKEKPYYCALPECDKSFTRSDALAKHMRTVHEPEIPRVADSTPAGKRGLKFKLSNGSSTPGSVNVKAPLIPTDTSAPPTVLDEEGNEVPFSPANDNITYIPAYHPITGQPGFMIHYPPDIQFSGWESSVEASQLMRLLRRQLHWAAQESAQLRKENEELERIRKEEWILKEILLEGIMEGEMAKAERDNLLEKVDEKVVEAMKQDIEPAQHLTWKGGKPAWRKERRTIVHSRSDLDGAQDETQMDETLMDQTQMEDDEDDGEEDEEEEDQDVDEEEDAGSPPPTGHSGTGGFEGADDPYDNYVSDMMERFEARKREQQKGSGQQETAEADAIGALMGLSGGST